MLQKLAPKTTACVLIDLQQDILGFGKAPRPAEAVLVTAATLAKRFREVNAPVVLVRVGWSTDFGDALKQSVDQPIVLPDVFPRLSLVRQSVDVLEALAG